MGMHSVVRAVEPAVIQQLETDPEAIEQLLEKAPDAQSLAQLQKSWHGLHYLMTGSSGVNAGELGFLLEGGTEVGDDLGYGPARVFAPNEVQNLSAALTQISEDDLWSRFDGDQMQAEGVYPVIWDEPEDELRSEYLQYFRALKSTVQFAGNTGKALVVALS